MKTILKIEVEHSDNAEVSINHDGEIVVRSKDGKAATIYNILLGLFIGGE